MKAFLETFRPVRGYEGLYEVSDFGAVRSLCRDKVKYMKKAKKRDGYEISGLFKHGKHKWYYIHRMVWEAFRGPIPEGMQIDHINGVKDDNRLANLRCVTPKENQRNPVTRVRHLEAIKKTTSSEQWRNNHREAMHQVANDQKWLEANHEACKRRSKDPKWIDAHREAMRKLADDPKWIEKHREASREANAKPVLQLDKDTGEVIREWQCARDAARGLGISRGNISECCNGKRNTTGGYGWKFR